MFSAGQCRLGSSLKDEMSRKMCLLCGPVCLYVTLIYEATLNKQHWVCLCVCAEISILHLDDATL